MIVVLNKMDIAKEADKGVLVDYVSQNVARVVGNRNIEPVRIFPVSGRQALDALNGMPSDSVSGSRMQLLQNSNINELKIYLTEELSQHNIVREKLLNPLRMMDRIIETISLQLTQRERLIEGDGRTIEFIIENMSMWSASVQQDACNYKQRIQHQRTQINSRCSDFIINEINPWNIKTLVSTSIFAEKFRTEVLVDMESTIVDTKSEFRELFAKRVRQQHRSVMHYVAERIKQHQSKIMGSVNIFMDDQITDRKIFPDIDRDINLLLSDFKPAREAEVLTRAISLATVFSAVSVAGGALGASICWISGWDILLSGACCIAGLTGSSAFFWRKNKLM